ncbi:Transmembrane protein 14C [Coemansia sp. RSA 1365]|nr:Transmembrane protein 14C [Coemansia sp. RSA 1365]
MSVDYLGLAFSVFIALGGIIGYLKSSSIASLVTGLSFGALISLSAQFASSQPKGYSMLPGTLCLVLCFVMGSRFLESKKFMPAGMVAATSLLMTIRYILKAY